MINHQLQNQLPAIREYFSKQPIIKAWLFGSYSRGDFNSNSDIDFLVQYDENEYISLFTISRIVVGLQKLLDKKVDLVENGCILPFAINSVEKDKILIYERTN